MFHFKEVEYGSTAYKATIGLRYKVLRKPLLLEFDPEVLALENTDYHLCTFSDNDILVACLIMTPLENNIIKMRQLAVGPELQGQGAGKGLVTFAEKWASEKHFNRIELHARQSAVPFYLKLGYKIQGEVFIEVTIPHLAMYKDSLVEV